MQTQRDRFTNLMDSELGKLKLKDKCKGEASGPQLVYAQDPNGNVGMTVGWQLTVWLEHNVLLGQDPIGVTVPVGVLLPTADMVTQITARLLEEARKLRHQATEQISAESKQSMTEAMRQVGRK
jgi:hypothetical protein